MYKFDNLDNYNGDLVYDMEVDYDYHINTGALLSNYTDTQHLP